MGVVAAFLEHAHALNTLHDDIGTAFAAFDTLDRDERADIVDFGPVRGILLGVTLRHGQQLLTVLRRRL